MFESNKANTKDIQQFNQQRLFEKFVFSGFVLFFSLLITLAVLLILFFFAYSFLISNWQSASEIYSHSFLFVQ